VLHTIADTALALLEARAAGDLTLTPGGVFTADGQHRLYQKESVWYAGSAGRITRVPAWFGEFLLAAVLAPAQAADGAELLPGGRRDPHR
jgi:hypothetical protein